MNPLCRAVFTKPLKRGTVVMDQEDVERVMKAGCLNIRKDFCVLVKGYVGTVNGRRRFRTQYLSRLIMNAPPGVEVDHINRNRLDNRKENLRLVSRVQNQINVAKQRGKWSSRFKGVSFVKRTPPLGKPWAAQIGFNRKMIHLGYFATQEEAAINYNKAARKLHGEYAYTNPVQ